MYVDFTTMDDLFISFSVHFGRLQEHSQKLLFSKGFSFLLMALSQIAYNSIEWKESLFNNYWGGSRAHFSLSPAQTKWFA